MRVAVTMMIVVIVVVVVMVVARDESASGGRLRAFGDSVEVAKADIATETTVATPLIVGGDGDETNRVSGGREDVEANGLTHVGVDVSEKVFGIGELQIGRANNKVGSRHKTGVDGGRARIDVEHVPHVLVDGLKVGESNADANNLLTRRRCLRRQFHNARSFVAQVVHGQLHWCACAAL